MDAGGQQLRQEDECDVFDRIHPECSRRSPAPGELALAGHDLGLGRIEHHREAQAKTDTVEGRLGEQRSAALGEIGAARQVIAGHELEGSPADDAGAVELAPVAQHLGEAVVVPHGRHQATAAGKDLGRSQIGRRARVIHQRASQARVVGPVCRGRRPRVARCLACRQRGCRVVGRKALDVGGWHLKARVGHAERPDHVVDEVLVERLTRDDLDDTAQNIGGVAVVPLGARIEQQRERCERFASFLEVAGGTPVEAVGPVQRVDLVGEVEVVGEAGGMGQQAVDGYFARRFSRLVLHHVATGEDACVRKLRDPTRDRILQLEAPLLVQLHRGDRHDGLGHRVDAIDGVCGDRQRPLAVSLAVAVGVRDLAAARQQHRHARQAPVVDIPIQMSGNALQPTGVEAHLGRIDGWLDV